MNNGPRPSKRVFISDLPSLPLDSKVRFLGCVKTYIISTGHLILEHNYPRPKPGSTSSSPSPCSVISVDINAVLETVKFDDLCVGAWVNVLGYVRRGHDHHCDQEKVCHALQLQRQQQQQQQQRKQHQSLPRDQAGSAHSVSCSVYVDAVLVFSAGSVEVGEYERVVSDSQDLERRLGQLTSH